MKLHSTFRFVPTLIASLVLALPATGLAEHKIKVYRDDDGDGHYNKKTIKTDRDHDRHHDRSRGHYYGGSSGHYYNGYSGYRTPHYSYGPSYYSRPYYYSQPRTSIGLSFSSRPSYYSSSVYRGRPAYSDGLASDVQRALKRNGYYYGSIDGDIGPGTRAAIRAYQDDRGLSVTGRIDRSLLRSLGVG